MSTAVMVSIANIDFRKSRLMDIGIVALVVLSLAFAWSMGAHYTGAVMGMPHASGSIAVAPALLGMAVMTVLGATFASHGVQETVGLRIIDPSQVDVRMAIIVEFGAFLLTTVYTYFKVPTSTIQILVFCVVGAGLAAGASIHWGTIGILALTWVLAPPVAAALGFVATKAFDLFLPNAKGVTEPGRLAVLPLVLVVVGLMASFVLGANDVANAIGIWASVHLSSYEVAGLAGGALMAIGALTWGQRILKRVAFDIVKMDLGMASAAQFVQALVVILAVTQGLFTSMNQALVGAMAGTGLARGRQTVQRRTLIGIVEGWAISPVTGAVLCFLLYKLSELF